MRMLIEKEQQLVAASEDAHTLSPIPKTTPNKQSPTSVHLDELHKLTMKVWDKLASQSAETLALYLMFHSEEFFFQAKQSKDSKQIRPALAQRAKIFDVYGGILTVLNETLEEQCKKRVEKEQLEKKQRKGGMSTILKMQMPDVEESVALQTCYRTILEAQREETVTLLEEEKAEVANRIHSEQDVELLEDLERILTLL